jgi:hypothetical protein
MTGLTVGIIVLVCMPIAILIVVAILAVKMFRGRL